MTYRDAVDVKDVVDAIMQQQQVDEEANRPPMPTDDPPPPYPVEHSLPTPDEVRNNLEIDGDHHSHVSVVPRKRSQRLMYIASVGAVLLIVIIAFSAGVAVSNRNQASLAIASNADSTKLDVNRLLATQQFLGDFVSSSKDIQTPGTPQNMAAEWIANKDKFQAPIPRDQKYDDSFSFVQRYVLAVFYYALGGDDWTHTQTLFLSERDECDWNFGLVVDAPTVGNVVEKTEWKMGVRCNPRGEVSYIFLPGNNLVGQLPRELNFLAGIEHFSLYKNKITGSLPDLSNWHDLTFLAIESNQLTGSLGDWFKFSRLEYLALGNNQLSGPLPSFSWASALKEVSLDTNRFIGGVDVFNAATNLKSLFIQYNALTGPITVDTLKDIQLETLDISDNLITGIFPTHFLEFITLDLHNNSLSGDFPEINAPYPIKYLSINENEISGSITNNVALLNDLEHFDVSYNQLTGQIPNTFDNMQNLKYIFFCRNDFDEGPIPELRDAKNLRELDLKGTNRVGSIPSWLGGLTKLELLDLHDNRIEGPIPESIGDLSKLRFLFLNRNMINGTIPKTMGYLQSLNMLSLDKNDITGNDAAICGYNEIKGLTYFVADCQEVSPCECCTKCCPDDDDTCNKLELQANTDDSYVRTQFVFSEDLKFKATYNDDSGN